jgi:hypothetical protein
MQALIVVDVQNEFSAGGLNPSRITRTRWNTFAFGYNKPASFSSPSPGSVITTSPRNPARLWRGLGARNRRPDLVPRPDSVPRSDLKKMSMARSLKRVWRSGCAP